MQYSEEFIVSIDISMCPLKEEYQGTVNTNNLRFLFYNNDYLKKVAILIKDLLRKKDLNRPYHGGISSYVLAMMLYGIIKKKEKECELSKSKHDNEYVQKKKKDLVESLRTNVYVQLCEICSYLKDFIPFKTLINPLEVDISPNPDIHLNIVDPFSNTLVKTSAFRIHEIIDELLSMKAFL
jgi:DNA polymerase sigma